MEVENFTLKKALIITMLEGTLTKTNECHKSSIKIEIQHGVGTSVKTNTFFGKIRYICAVLRYTD